VTNPAQPLTGVTVLDLAPLPPGSYCTVLLADLGANVIRVEAPTGRRYEGPVGLNRGKRSVAVDQRHPRGQEVLRQLAAHADVLIEHERPGSMDEHGFGYSHAAVELPALIWCSLSGYGQDGPYAKWGGHDLSIAAHSGLLTAVNPDLPWYPQQILPIPIGALMASVGILAALRERDRTGVGCQLDISLSESATWVLSSTDDALKPTRRGIPTGPDRHLYECAEGTWIAVTAAEPRSWNALCGAVGLADLIDTLHQWQDPDAVTERLASTFQQRRADEWVAQLGPLGASVVRVNRGEELRHDPQIAARGVFQSVGDVQVPRSPIRIRDGKDERPRPDTYEPHTAGADTRAVLEEAGLDAATIDELERSGIVGPHS
jgi:alpha-methylacyl-CoA racemase